MNNHRDYYKILGLDRKASRDDIQRAYRKLARKYHPDINAANDAEERFKEINEAYEVLGDPDKRARYDQFGNDWNAQFANQAGAGSGGVHFNFGTANAEEFSDFFHDFFGSGSWGVGPESLSGGATRRRRGRDHESSINITLAEAYSGAKKEIELESVVQGPNGRPIRTRQRFEVSIPQGVTDGSLIRLPGQGGSGSGGGAAGDLFLRVNILPDSRFSLDGYDLTTTVDIAPWEAALGAKIPVPTVDGRINLTIAPGTQSGQTLRVRGKGMPVTPGRHGDLLVNVRIVVPEHLSAREQHLFKELAKESRFRRRE